MTYLSFCTLEFKGHFATTDHMLTSFELTIAQFPVGRLLSFIHHTLHQDYKITRMGFLATERARPISHISGLSPGPSISQLICLPTGAEHVGLQMPCIPHWDRRNSSPSLSACGCDIVSYTGLPLAVCVEKIETKIRSKRIADYHWRLLSWLEIILFEYRIDYLPISRC